MNHWLLSHRLFTSLRTDGFARFVNIVSVSAICLGTLSLLLSLSILNGYEERILETATQFTSHVEIRSSALDGITLSPSEVQRIRELQGVVSVDSILMREALIRTRTGIDGVVIHGMNAERIQQLKPALISGTLPADATCVIGEALARRLSLGIGDSVLFYSMSAQTPTADSIAAPPVPSATLFTRTISGIVATGMQSVDASMIVMPKRSLSTATGSTTGQVTMLTLELANPDRADITAVALLTILPPQYQIVTWKDRYASVANWIELQKQPIPIVLGLISIVAAFSLVSTLLVGVVLKTRSLAILASLGMPYSTLTGLVLRRGLWLGFVGTALGSSVAALLIGIQHTWHVLRLDGAIYYVSTLPVSLSIAPFILVPLSTILLAAIATIVPMVVVARQRIVRGIQFR